MELSQELILKVILQHYYGLFFVEKFEGISLRVVVSHPKITNVFKINLVYQTTLLNKIVIPVRENINFLGKNPNKKRK